MRRLKTEGATFVEVLRSVREARALHFLADGNRSVGETAQRLGFADPAAFSCAFKRWTGRSPKEVRRRLGSSAKGCRD